MKGLPFGLRSRNVSSTHNRLRLIRRVAEGSAAAPGAADSLFLRRLALLRYAGPLAALAVLITACFTLPLHRWNRSSVSVPGAASVERGSSAGQPADTPLTISVPNASGPEPRRSIRFTIPAIREHGGSYALAFWFVVNALLLTLSVLYWLERLRAADSAGDSRYKRLMLRLICTAPAFAGVMAASVIAGSDLGGHAVAATLGAAGVIASALLIATVVGRSASTVAVVIMALVMGLTDIFPAWATVAAALGGVVGQYPARMVRNRTAVIRCAALAMAAAGVGAFVAALVGGRGFGPACSIAMQALLTGCLGAAVWFTLLTLMEGPCQLTTPLGLLELLDPTRPMLERFAREAPGTFAHSLMVGHLAASAAEAIGADPLLCRVAAQYHDIGKLSRAQFFKENQQNGDNVHDRLAPSLSAIIVNSHVRDGERMARELGLPPVIQDIITQHHGTTLMRYFYYRASAGTQPSGSDPLQYQFRYPGPKPQTKEAGIMMFADAVEAASRTLPQPNRETVRAMVDSIVDDRLDDHQLDECPLTLKDITTIRATLADVVCAMLHQRIEYPGRICDDDGVSIAEPVAVDAFDFYENFDPAILLTPPARDAEPGRVRRAKPASGRGPARPGPFRPASDGEAPGHRARRRA